MTYDMHPEDYYDLSDVFGVDKFFYKNSTVRIVGWETPVSLIYSDGKSVYIKFKKELLKYASSFEDTPIDCKPDSLFYDLSLKNHMEEAPLRQLAFALQQYKAQTNQFSTTQLFPKDVQIQLEKRYLYLPEEYLLSDDGANPLYDATCYWFPVDVDAVLISNKTENKPDKSSCVIVDFRGKRTFGNIGYDGNFYHFDLQTMSGNSKKPAADIFDVENGLKKIGPVSWNQSGFDSFYPNFLREYIVLRDNTCYDYSGKVLPDRTRHYKNIAFVNSIIRLLRKKNVLFSGRQPRLSIEYPQQFDTVNIDLVETVIFPYLRSFDALNETAAERFMEVKIILVKAGLSNQFESAFKTILDMNQSPVYGGSKKNICGKALIASLQKLQKKLLQSRFSALLNDEVECKRTLATMNGSKVIDYTVSETEFDQISNYRRLPKKTKELLCADGVEEGHIIIFHDGSGKSFFAVTTSTKAGLGINRV